jgi:hypothetical protein
MFCNIKQRLSGRGDGCVIVPLMKFKDEVRSNDDLKIKSREFFSFLNGSNIFMYLTSIKP